MNTDEKKEEGSAPVVPPTAPKMRQIVIETDGNVVNLIRADVAGKIELTGILRSLMEFLNQQK